MNQLDRLSIKHKLLIPGVLVIAGFISVALIYQYQVSVRENAESESFSISSFNTTLKAVLEQYRQNEVYEKQFLLHGGSQYAELIGSGETDIKTLISRLETKTPNLELRTLLTTLETALGKYSDEMEQLVSAKRKVGFDESLGLRGELLKSVQKVEASLRKLNDLDLENAMLRMRRYQRDFLLQSGDASIAGMEQEKERFITALEESSMPIAEKAVVQKAFDQYSADFIDLTEGVYAMEKAVIEGEEATRIVESEIKTITAATEALRAEKHTELKNTAYRIGIFFYTVLFIIGAVVVGILLLLSRAISRSLDHLILRMRDLAEGGGDLSLRLPVSGTDETAILAGLVNRMMDNISSLIGKVLESGNQIASSVTQIAASTREQEATVTEHAATTSEIASSVKEISSTSKHLGATAEEVNTLVQGTAASAGDAQILLTRLDGSMGRMAQASTSIADKLAVLNEKANNIGAMVKTINKVADQTNLLSLNAAIEAEKAGEYGRGFAVVATEIRRLADQTAVATYDIEQMVSEVQSAISAGVMGIDKFAEEIHSSVEEARKAGEQMEKTIEQVQSLAPHMESVNEGLQAQVEGAEMIDEAMANLSESAQQTAEFVRQSNSAITELNHVARNLQEGATIFTVAA